MHSLIPILFLFLYHSHLSCRILCTNRDEFLARPALAAAFHSFGDTAHPNSDSPVNSEGSKASVLSGRDTQAGGTWLGLAPQTGRVALLTNITEPYQRLPSSRGALAPAFLLGQPGTPLEELYPQASYAGFNLLVLEAEWDEASPAESVSISAAAPTSAVPTRLIHFPHASLVSNNGGGGPLAWRALRADERASGSLSNGLHVSGTGGEAWPKVVQGRALFADAVRAHDEALREDGKKEGDADAALAHRLFALLRTTAVEPVRAREELRRTICVSPLEIHLNGAQPPSSVPALVKDKAYGTRTASVLLVRRSGEALFVERDVWRLTSEGVKLYVGGAVGGTGAGDEDGERLFRLQVGVGAPG